MSKYRIVVQDQGESRIKDRPIRFVAEIEEWRWLAWVSITDPYCGATEDGARKKAETALDEIRNPPEPKVRIYYYD